MEPYLEIAKYILPSLVVFVTAYLVLRKFMDNEYRKQLLLAKQNNQKIITPLRLQAYERMVLFLERIAPNNLVMRVKKEGMNAKFLRAALIETVRKEYEHNLTQQIYVSSTGWETAKKAKDEVIKIVNIAFSKVKEDDPGTALAQQIFSIVLQLEDTPTNIALNGLKKEVRHFY